VSTSVSFAPERKTSMTKHAAADGGSYSIRAVQRVCDVLDLIQARHQGFSLSEVADVTGMPKSSAFRYLSTLEERRYVTRDVLTGAYHIGPAFLPLQAQQLAVMADRARPHLERLRDRFGETVNLGMLDGNRVAYVEIVESQRSMRLSARRGDRDPLHCTALGKAIASSLPWERVVAILEADGMPRKTDATITDPGLYQQELERTREQGYAIDNGENEPDGRCVAVPFPDAPLPASVSLSAPAARFPLRDVPKVVAALQEVVEALSPVPASEAAPTELA
jgi:IclR family transcriptional regulator, acetate operon repressor